MNALLIDFLGVTSAGFTGMWADEHVTMLEQGLERLPAPLAAHEAAFAAVRDCGFDEKLELTEPARQAEELAAQTRRRLEAGPELLPFARAKRDLDKWKVEQDTKREEARARTCRGAATAAKIFYAAEDEKGRTAWWFCDGSEVSIAPGGELTYAQGTAKRAAKKPKSYVTSTGKFPPGEIQRSPKLPARKLAPAPAKEEHDVLEPNDGL